MSYCDRQNNRRLRKSRVNNNRQLACSVFVYPSKLALVRLGPTWGSRSSNEANKSSSSWNIHTSLVSSPQASSFKPQASSSKLQTPPQSLCLWSKLNWTDLNSHFDAPISAKARRRSIVSEPSLVVAEDSNWKFRTLSLSLSLSIYLRVTSVFSEFNTKLSLSLVLEHRVSKRDTLSSTKLPLQKTLPSTIVLR